MTTVATPPMPPAQAKPRRRWWQSGLLLVALVVAAFVAAYFAFTYQAGVSLAEAEAEADRIDPDWRLDALEAKRRVVADADNSALHVIAVIRKGKGVSVGAVPNYDVIFKNLPPSVELNHQQSMLIGGELGKVVNPLAEARKLKDTPYGRFPITYSPDFIGTLIPHHQNSRQITDWLVHDAYLLAQDDQPDLAIESCRAIFNAGRTVGDEPFLVTHMMRIAIQTQGVIAAERVLAQGEPADETLAQLQSLLAIEIAESSWRRGLRGDRAGTHVFVTGIRSGAVTMAGFRASLRMARPPGIQGWLQEFFPATIWRSYPEYLQHLTAVVELSKRPLHEQRNALRALDAALAEKNLDNPIAFLVPPGKLNVYEAECRSQAQLRSMWVAIACERYRLTHDRWPETLDVILKEKQIDAIPLDPYDGQPLRYRRTNDGVVVYALGSDLTDDQGRIDRDQSNTPGFDVGFRLWDRGLRRQPPLPPVAVPE